MVIVQRHLLVDPRDLDEHRQIGAGHDLDTILIEEREAEVRRSPAEHVDDDEDTALNRQIQPRCPVLPNESF